MSCPFHGQRTFFTIVVHGSSGFQFFFWAGSHFCLLDIVPTVVLLWQFILPVTTTLCILQYFLWCAQIKTWSFSDIEKTFPCHQYFLSASGVWARYWQFTLFIRHDNFFFGNLLWQLFLRTCFQEFLIPTDQVQFEFPTWRTQLARQLQPSN